MKKWYRMPRVKFFLLAAAHILAAAGVLCILWATRYPMLIQELCSADAAKTYEESNAFANAVANANYHILDEIQYQTLYDTDGKYDPDKIVDVAKAMEPLYTSKPQLDRSGMGFSFMEAFMDALTVTSEPGHGTTVKMKKVL